MKELTLYFSDLSVGHYKVGLSGCIDIVPIGYGQYLVVFEDRELTFSGMPAMFKVNLDDKENKE